MPRTKIALSVSIALAAVQAADAAFNWTVHSDLSSWATAVNGANECTFDFEPIGPPVSGGFGSFTDQYGGFGVLGAGQFYGAGGEGPFPGLPYSQVGMSPDSAWVHSSLGFQSGLVTRYDNLRFIAPITGMAFWIRGAAASGFVQASLYRDGQYLGFKTYSISNIPSYGLPGGGTTAYSKLMAFTTDVEFDYISFQGSGFFVTESLWVPTNAIPMPATCALVGLALGVSRRRR